MRAKGSQEILIQGIAFTMDALLFIHLGVEAAALFHGIG